MSISSNANGGRSGTASDWTSQPASDRPLCSIKDEPHTSNDCLLSISSILGQCNFGDLDVGYSSRSQSTVCTQKKRRLQRQKIEDVVLTLKNKKLGRDKCLPDGTSLVGSQNSTLSDTPAAEPLVSRSSPISVPDRQFSNSRNRKLDGTSSMGSQNTTLSDTPSAEPLVLRSSPRSVPGRQSRNRKLDGTSSMGSQNTTLSDTPSAEPLVLRSSPRSVPDRQQSDGTSSMGSRNTTLSDTPSAEPLVLRSSPTNVPDRQSDGTSSMGSQNTTLSDSSAAEPLISRSSSTTVPAVLPVAGCSSSSAPSGQFNPQSIRVCSSKETVDVRPLGPLGASHSPTVSPEDILVGSVQSSEVVSNGSGLHCDSEHSTDLGSSGLPSTPGTVSKCPVQTSGTSCQILPTDSIQDGHVLQQTEQHRSLQTSASKTVVKQVSRRQSQETTAGTTNVPLPETRLHKRTHSAGNSRRAQNQAKFKCLFPLCNETFPTKECLQKHLRYFPQHNMKLVPVSPSSDFSCVEACDVFMSKDLSALDRKCRMKEFVKHLSHQEIKETLLPSIMKQGTFDSLSSADIESSTPAGISKFAALLDLMEQGSQPMHTAMSGCRGTQVAALIESFECFRSRVEEKLTAMVISSCEWNDLPNAVVQGKQPSVNNCDDQHSTSHNVEQGHLPGVLPQVQCSGLAARRTKLMQNHLIVNCSSVDRSGALGDNTTNCVQSERGVRAAVRAARTQASARSCKDSRDPRRVLSESDSKQDQLPPHSLSLPFKLVDGEFKRKALPKINAVTKEGFVKFIKTYPVEASREILTVVTSGKSFFRDYLMTTFYKQNYDAFLAFACKLASNVSLPSDKTGTFWHGMGVDLEQVLGINVLPSPAAFITQQMNMQKDSSTRAETRRSAAKRRREEPEEQRKKGSRKGRRKALQEKEMQDIATEDGKAHTEHQPQGDVEEAHQVGTRSKDEVDVIMTSSHVSLTGENRSFQPNPEQMEVNSATCCDGDLTAFEHPSTSSCVDRPPTSPLPCHVTINNTCSPPVTTTTVVSASSGACVKQGGPTTSIVAGATCTSNGLEPCSVASPSCISVTSDSLFNNATETSYKGAPLISDACPDSAVVASAARVVHCSASKPAESSGVDDGARKLITSVTLSTTSMTPNSTSVTPNSTSITPSTAAVPIASVTLGSTMKSIDASVTPNSTSVTLSTTSVAPNSTSVTPNSTSITPSTSAVPIASVTLGSTTKSVDASVTPNSTSIRPSSAAVPINTSETVRSAAKSVDASVTSNSTSVTPISTVLPINTSVTPRSTPMSVDTSVTPNSTSMTPLSTVMPINTSETPRSTPMSVDASVTPNTRSITPNSSVLPINTSVTPRSTPMSVDTSVTPNSTSVTPSSAILPINTSMTLRSAPKSVDASVTPNNTSVTPISTVPMSVDTSVTPSSAVLPLSSSMTLRSSPKSVDTSVTPNSTSVTPSSAVLPISSSMTLRSSPKSVDASVTPNNTSVTPISTALPIDTSVTLRSAPKLVETSVTPNSTSMTPRIACVPINSSMTLVSAPEPVGTSVTPNSTSVTPISAAVPIDTIVALRNTPKSVDESVTPISGSMTSSSIALPINTSATPRSILKPVETSVTLSIAICESITHSSTSKSGSTSVTPSSTATSVCSSVTRSRGTPSSVTKYNKSTCSSVTCYSPAESISPGVTPSRSKPSDQGVTPSSTATSVCSSVTRSRGTPSSVTKYNKPTCSSVTCYSPAESISPGVTPSKSKPSDQGVTPSSTAKPIGSNVASSKATELDDHPAKSTSTNAPCKSIEKPKNVMATSSETLGSCSTLVACRNPSDGRAGITRTSSYTRVKSACASSRKSTRTCSTNVAFSDATKLSRVSLTSGSATKSRRKGVPKSLKSTRLSVTRDSHPQSVSASVTRDSQPQFVSASVTRDSHPQSVSASVTRDSHPQFVSPSVTRDSHPQSVSASVTRDSRPQSVSASVTRDSHPQFVSASVTRDSHAQSMSASVTRDSHPQSVSASVTRDSHVQSVSPSVTRCGVTGPSRASLKADEAIPSGITSERKVPGDVTVCSNSLSSCPNGTAGYTSSPGPRLNPPTASETTVRPWKTSAQSPIVTSAACPVARGRPKNSGSAHKGTPRTQNRTSSTSLTKQQSLCLIPIDKIPLPLRKALGLQADLPGPVEGNSDGAVASTDAKEGKKNVLVLVSKGAAGNTTAIQVVNFVRGKTSTTKRQPVYLVKAKNGLDSAVRSAAVHEKLVVPVLSQTSSTAATTTTACSVHATGAAAAVKMGHSVPHSGSSTNSLILSRFNTPTTNSVSTRHNLATTVSIPLAGAQVELDNKSPEGTGVKPTPLFDTSMEKNIIRRTLLVPLQPGTRRRRGGMGKVVKKVRRRWRKSASVACVPIDSPEDSLRALCTDSQSPASSVLPQAPGKSGVTSDTDTTKPLANQLPPSSFSGRDLLGHGATELAVGIPNSVSKGEPSGDGSDTVRRMNNTTQETSSRQPPLASDGATVLHCLDTQTECHLGESLDPSVTLNGCSDKEPARVDRSLGVSNGHTPETPSRQSCVVPSLATAAENVDTSTENESHPVENLDPSVTLNGYSDKEPAQIDRSLGVSNGHTPETSSRQSCEVPSGSIAAEIVDQPVESLDPSVTLNGCSDKEPAQIDRSLGVSNGHPPETSSRQSCEVPSLATAAENVDTSTENESHPVESLDPSVTLNGCSDEEPAKVDRSLGVSNGHTPETSSRQSCEVPSVATAAENVDTSTENESHPVESLDPSVTLNGYSDEEPAKVDRSLGVSNGHTPETSSRQSCEVPSVATAAENVDTLTENESHPVENLDPSVTLNAASENVDTLTEKESHPVESFEQSVNLSGSSADEQAVPEDCEQTLTELQTVASQPLESSDLVGDVTRASTDGGTGATVCPIKKEPTSFKTSRKRRSEVTRALRSKTRVLYVPDEMVPNTSHHVSPSRQGAGVTVNGKRKREN